MPGPGVTEETIDAETPAEGGATANAHGCIGDSQSRVVVACLDREHLEESASAGRGHRSRRISQVGVAAVDRNLHPRELGPDRGQGRQRFADMVETGSARMRGRRSKRRASKSQRNRCVAEVEPRQHHFHHQLEATAGFTEAVIDGDRDVHLDR